jgi:hypothetical protein
MRLYLVRWPTLVASIVRADDEDHLTDILDEVASPSDAVWTEYEGPLWVDMKLGIDAQHDSGEWRLSGVEEASRRFDLGAELGFEQSDTSADMFESVLAMAFPHLAEVLERAQESDTLDPAEVRGAALMDLWLHRPSGELPAWLREMFRLHAKQSPGQ